MIHNPYDLLHHNRAFAFLRDLRDLRVFVVKFLRNFESL